MTKNTLRKILHEAIKLDVEKGDVILTGRFKNKRRIVKTIGTDRFGQPTINGKSILKFKIEKHMPKNKMSAKTREEMNEMKLLRDTIRGILLESADHYQKLITMFASKDLENIRSAVELGIAMGYFKEIPLGQEENETWWDCLLETNDDFCDAFVEQHPDGITVYRGGKRNAYGTNEDGSINVYPHIPPPTMRISWPKKRR